MCILLYYHIIIFFLSTNAQKITPLCQYAVAPKYFGHYDYSSGHSNARSFLSVKALNRDDCNKKCKYNNKCFATSFDIQSNNCSFYNTTKFFVDNFGQIQYSKWIQCDMNEGHQPPDGRCYGLWVIYDDKFITVNDYGILIRKAFEKACYDECLDNHLCGSVNVYEEKCILVPKWPHWKLNITDKTDSKLYKWTCVDNFVNNINISRHQYQPNQQKCTGYWSISNRHYQMNENDIKWLNFQTQSYNDCLAECDQHSHCFRAYYNITYSMCVLYQIELSDPIYHHDMIAIVFEWICVKNDSRNPSMNEVEKRYLNMGMNCYRIVNTKHLLIGMDECGKYPPQSKFTPCSGNHRGYDWSIKDSCLIKQSYWMYPTKTISINDTDGQKLWNLTKIFTGLQTYWLLYLTDNNLLKVDYLECRIFNSARSKEILKSNQIISRDGYQALSPNGPLLTYKKMPSKLSITSSQQPCHSCKTRTSCTDILRWLQVGYFKGTFITKHYYDIPFNFMIDENGMIYECRGWKHRCEAVKPYNGETICIGYIGWFRDKLPGEKFLNSVKKLIEFAVDHKYLSSDYKLYIQQDLGKAKVKRNLEIVIKNWYRYRGFNPEDCTNISILIIIFNFIVVLIVSTIFLTLIYIMFNFKKSCKQCKFLSNNQLQWRQLIPSNHKDDSLLELNHSNDDSDINFVIYEKWNLISGGDHLKSIKLIKIWFYNKYLNGMNCRSSGNTFTNYLNGFPFITNNMLILEADLPINDHYRSYISKVVLCLSNSASLIFLKSLIRRGFCICHYFSVDPVKLSSISMNIDIIN